jgi:hypothetical protein
MDFDAVGTVVAILMILGLTALAFSRIRSGAEEKDLGDIVESARNGQEDFIRLTAPSDMDICWQLGASAGCDSELGVEPWCKLYRDTDYIIRAEPTEEGVCITVEEVS